jgi:hypothetical protein
MKTTLLALVALAVASAAAAAPSPTSVTITAQPPIVGYGSPTTLSGTVTPQQKGAKVALIAQPCGTTAAKAVATVTTSAQGNWSAQVAPTVRTAYHVKVKGTLSSTATVAVRPQVSLTKVASHRFRTGVVVAESLAGKIALFQKRTARRWKTVKSIVLAQLSTGPGSTVVSGASFRSGVRAGKTLRILLTQRQVGACYLRATSKTIVS